MWYLVLINTSAEKVTKENSKLLKTLLEQEDVLQRICLALDNDKPSCGNFNRVAQECGYTTQTK